MHRQLFEDKTRQDMEHKSRELYKDASSGKLKAGQKWPGTECQAAMLTQICQTQICKKSTHQETWSPSCREMYQDAASGKLKPGKKGLALSAEQWRALRAEMPALDAALQARDVVY